MRVLTLALVAATAATTLAAPAAAKVPLRDVAAIDDQLMYIAIADRLRKDCDDISPRILRAIGRINELKDSAKARGYTDAEIEAYHSSKSEQRRMKAKATGWLQARGVSVKDKAGFCAFGRQEIAKGSRIGTLLRER